MVTTTAIKELIVLYRNGEHNPSTDNCPLCTSTRTKRSPEYDCKLCPNNAFAEECGLPCVRRTRKYDLLNWNCESDKIADFWDEVRKYIVGKNKRKYTPEMDNDILEIAEKYR